MLTLLSGHSLTPERLVSAEAMSLSLSERESTASLTPVSMDGIGINSWLKDNDEPGAGIVWRVKSIRTVFMTDTPEIELEHAIGTLRDRLLFGEVTPATMGGGSTCTARQAVTYILNQQSDWVLGSFDYDSVSNAYKFDGDSLFDALEAVSNTLTDPWWSYDFSTYPFKLNITAKASGVACELRAGRNLATVTKTVDRSGMYTRFYPIGKDDLHLPGGGYVERNTATYGVISKTETDTSLESAAQLTAWANERLAKHAEPLVNITADGLELSEATGEPLDRLQLGRICRIPLPEFGGAQIEERITQLTYQDKVHQPEAVQVTLANSQEDVTRIIADNMKRSGRGGRAAGRQSAEDHAWIEDTDEYVKLTAIAVGGKDSQGNPDWTRISELTVDGNGIDARVTLAEGEIVTHEGRLTVNENAIEAEVADRSNADTELSGKLIVQSDKVGLVVTVTDTRDVLSFPSYYRFPSTGSPNYVYLDVGSGYYYEWKNGAYSRIQYSKVINTGGITSAINADNEIETRISGDRIYIGDTSQSSTTVINGKCELSDVTAPYIKGLIADIPMVEYNTLDGATVYASSSVQAANIYFDDDGALTSLKNGIKDLQITRSGNTYTLQKKDFDDSDWVDVGTFSRATTLSGTWSSGKLTVTPSPQQQPTYVRTLYPGTTTYDSSTKTYTVPIVAKWGSSDQYSENTGKNIYVDATTQINSAGYAGRAAVTLQDPTWSPYSGQLPISRTVTVKTTGRTNSSGTTDNLEKSVALFLTQGSWSSGSMTVNMRVGSTTGTAYAATTISLTEHTNCKANVYELKINGNRGKVKIYYKDGSNYVAPFSDSYYWYRSSTAADPTTYYST